MALNNNTQEILELFRKHGHIEYGENVTQLSHAFQAGIIAQEKGYDHELVLAAFLHDIGHIIPLEKGQGSFQTMGEYGMESHDRWGGEYLRSLGFSERIWTTVENHVASKRYLCYADPAYFEDLSEASRITLSYQGGPMDEKEAEAFEQDPFFSDSILIRRIDEEAKDADFTVTDTHWDFLTRLLNGMEKMQGNK